MGEYNDNSSWYHIIPIIFIVAVLPLIVKLKVVPLKGASYDYWKGMTDNFDFFSYYKMVWLLIAAGTLIIIFCIKLYKRDIELNKSRIYIPIIIYVLFILLSTIFADYKTIATMGFPDRYEGLFVLLAYIVIMLIVMNFKYSEKHIKIIISALFVSAFMLSVIGLLQYFGHDVFQWELVKKVLLQSSYDKYGKYVRYSAEPRTIYLTLYHYNYVGSYMAMIFPLTFTLALLSSNRIYKAILGILSVLTFCVLILSNSRAGIIGVSAAAIVLIICLRRKIICYWRYGVVGIITIIIFTVGLNYVSNGRITRRLESLLSDMKGIVATNSVIDSNDPTLKDLNVNKTNIKLTTNTESLSITLADSKLLFRDDKDELIEAKVNQENKAINFNDDRYKTYTINFVKINNQNSLQLINKDITLYFALINNKEFKLIDFKGKEIEYKPVEKFGFEGKEKLGSARGYIWSRTIPLLKSTIILGHGPDTFAAYFPQYDFQGKMIAYGDMWLIVDKVHNIYLQNAINTGIVSLIAFLTIIMMYTVQSIKIYKGNSFDSFYDIISIAIFTAIFGYLAAGMFNDSVVSVAPVFWVLLGIGISINLKILNGSNIKTKS